jgi:hypothetical protein
MKPFVTLAATALFTWTATAAFAAPPANANFSAERGQPFSLVLDGRLLTQPLARQVHVGPLLPGRHWADFTLPSPYGRSLHFRTAVWLQPGVETSYVLLLRPGYGPQLQQVGAVALYGPGRVGQGYPGAYPPPNAPYGGSYPVQPAPPYGNQPQADGRYQLPNQPNGAYGNGQPGGYNSPATPAPTPPYPGTYPPRSNAPGNGSYYPNNAPAPNNGGYDPNPNTAPPANNGGYADPNLPDGNNLQPFSPDDIQNLTQDLRNEPSDEARLSLVKEALAENSVQAEELAQLMGTLKLSKSRTELAKYGYSHVSDPENFSRVYEVLRYPASIQEVQQALGLPQN